MNRVRVVVENSTAYRTQDIAAIVRAGLKAHGLTFCRVTVKYRRWGSGCLGRAYVGERRGQPAHRMWLNAERPLVAVPRGMSAPALPNGYQTDDVTEEAIASVNDRLAFECARKLAQTIDHEIYHLRGLHHRNFPAHVKKEPPIVPWFVESMRVRVNPPAQKRVVSLDEKREAKLSHAKTMHERAKTRAKRAATIEKKWRRRVRGIERTIAQAAKVSR